VVVQQMQPMQQRVAQVVGKQETLELALLVMKVDIARSKVLKAEMVIQV
jgi:hypothetical protein